MPYDTQADFMQMYHGYLVDPDTNERYDSHRNPAKYGNAVINIKLFYHPIHIKPEKEALADRLISRYSIDANDSLIIFGGAFGWLGEWLENKTGCACVSVDTSTWINAVQDQSADDELVEAITASGLDHTSGIGKGIFDKFSDPGPRCKITGGVINESLSNNGSRNRVRARLPRNPTRIITEEVWQALTPAEQTTYASRLTEFGVAVTHVIDNQIIDGP